MSEPKEIRVKIQNRRRRKSLCGNTPSTITRYQPAKLIAGDSDNGFWDAMIEPLSPPRGRIRERQQKTCESHSAPRPILTRNP
jgi:hypothetical protein